MLNILAYDRIFLRWLANYPCAEHVIDGDGAAILLVKQFTKFRTKHIYLSALEREALIVSRIVLTTIGSLGDLHPFETLDNVEEVFFHRCSSLLQHQELLYPISSLIN